MTPHLGETHAAVSLSMGSYMEHLTANDEAAKDRWVCTPHPFQTAGRILLACLTILGGVALAHG